MADPAHPELKNQGMVLFQPGATRDSKIDMSTMEFKHPMPHLITIDAPVVGANDQALGDACDIAAKAIEAWSSFMKSHGLSGNN